MSKVIRIDDEIFLRLQALAEPLIDNPSTVINRLLDYYESSISAGRSSGSPVPNSSQSAAVFDKSRKANLFLAPATGENMNKTIAASVSLGAIQHALTENEIKGLRAKSHDTSRLHCWAMTSKRRAVFDSMKEGDIVLFSKSATGKFEYYGEVVYKIENEKLGNYLWDVVPGEPWRLIYFLENIRCMDIDKARLVVELGYKSNFNVPGVIKVNPMNIEIVVNRYGSVKSFLNQFKFEGK